MKRNGWITKKLRRESGASLSAALLVFLMCACVGSVVLAAGNTTAGRVSSPEEQSNRERYAVSSAADLIMSQMEKNSSMYQSMSVSSSWKYTYTESDYEVDAEGNVNAGGKTLSEGSYVESSDWEPDVKNDGTTCDLSQYINMNDGRIVGSLSSADNFGILRDILSYGIYHHYWEEISGYSEESSEDPWDSMTAEDDWNPSGTYSINTDENDPIKISVDDFSDVYCEIIMDQDFTMYIDVYCLETVNDQQTKVSEKWLTYRTEDASVTRNTALTEKSRVTGDLADTGLTNTVVTYEADRSLTLNVTWDTGSLTADKPEEASA